MFAYSYWGLRLLITLFPPLSKLSNPDANVPALLLGRSQHTLLGRRKLFPLGQQVGVSPTNPRAVPPAVDSMDFYWYK